MAVVQQEKGPKALLMESNLDAYVLVLATINHIFVRLSHPVISPPIMQRLGIGA